MMELVRKLGQRVIGVLSGFDRILVRGILRCVISPRGLNGYLFGAGVPMTKFAEHAEHVSELLKQESCRQARDTGREVRYLEGSQDRKKDIALEIARRDGIREGLICVLSCVEPCMSFHVRRDRSTKTIALERRRRKCLHLYHYFHHAQLGLMHVRLQTWFPFTMQVYFNGREWLARELDKAGIGYVRRDNCICQVDDLEAAQRLLNKQLRVSWTSLLNRLARQVHPAHETIFAKCPEHARNYYWSIAETEWASDVLFRDPADVLPVCERLASHSLRVHGPADVMRFLGRTVRSDGLPRASFGGEIHSDARVFYEGLRIKHRVNANSVKMYNRPGVLRIETTINNPSEFKVWRTRENSGADEAASWLRLRKGVADLHRRAQVSQASNDRFATAQAAVLNEEAMPLKDLTAALCRPVVRPGRLRSDAVRARSRRFRALNPLSHDDIQLLTAVAQPQYVVSGLRNQDLRRELYGADPTDAVQQRRRSSATSRKLSLLRAHGLLEKIAKTHRYRVTMKGRHALTAVLAAANATAGELIKLAA
jgi:hypothetical protein